MLRTLSYGGVRFFMCIALLKTFTNKIWFVLIFLFTLQNKLKNKTYGHFRKLHELQQIYAPRGVIC